jgi:tetratricopeptide (TPR) repeat protein
LPRGKDGHADLAAFRDRFVKASGPAPEDAEAIAQPYLESKDDSAHRAEANYLMAQLRLRQKQYAGARQFSKAVGRDASATASQRSAALLVGLQALCGDSSATAGAVDASFAEAQRFPYLSDVQEARMLDTVGDYYFAKKDFEKSIGHARRQLAFEPRHEQGRVLNRIATLHDLLDRPGDAVASRKEAVRILSAQLTPVPPRSIFGAMMTSDLFEALCGIPTATLEEKKAAAALVLAHEIAPPALKDKVRKKLMDLEKNNK